jgi:hypothetical protein
VIIVFDQIAKDVMHLAPEVSERLARFYIEEDISEQGLLPVWGGYYVVKRYACAAKRMQPPHYRIQVSLGRDITHQKSDMRQMVASLLKRNLLEATADHDLIEGGHVTGH